MASLTKLLTLSITLIYYFSSSSPSTATTSDLIHQTCNTTAYYDLCVSSLQSSSTTTTKAGLATAIVTIAMSNATNTSSYLSNTTSSSSDPALKSCSTRYAEACAALHGALDALAVEMYDYAYLQASAAGECARTCRDAFGRRRPKVAYLAELARREEGLARLCTIALQIINQLVV